MGAFTDIEKNGYHSLKGQYPQASTRVSVFSSEYLQMSTFDGASDPKKLPTPHPDCKTGMPVWTGWASANGSKATLFPGHRRDGDAVACLGWSTADGTGANSAPSQGSSGSAEGRIDTLCAFTTALVWTHISSSAPIYLSSTLLLNAPSSVWTPFCPVLYPYPTVVTEADAPHEIEGHTMIWRAGSRINISISMTR